VRDRDPDVPGRKAQGLERLGDAGLHGRPVEHDDPVVGSVFDDAPVRGQHPAHELRRRGGVREVQRIYLDDGVIGPARSRDHGHADQRPEQGPPHVSIIRSKLGAPNILHYDAH